MNIIKKDGRLENFDFNKIVTAVQKSAARVDIKLDAAELSTLESEILARLQNIKEIHVKDLHTIVELSLDKVNSKVANSYRNYRNYKKDYVEMMEDTLKTADDLNYHADRSNANTTAGLISTKRSLIYTAFNKNLYKKVFLSNKEYVKITRSGNDYVVAVGKESGATITVDGVALSDSNKTIAKGTAARVVAKKDNKTVFDQVVSA